MQNIWHLIKLIPSGRVLFIWSTLFIALEGIINSLSPFFIRNLTNAVLTPKAGQEAAGIVAPLIALGILSLVTASLDWITSLFSARLQSILGTSLRLQIFEQLSALSIDYFERTRVGEVVQKVGQSIGELLNWLGTASNFLFVQVVGAVFSLTILFHIDVTVGVIMLVATAISMTYHIRLVKRNRIDWRESRANTERALGIGTETLSHISTIRSFSQESSRLSRMGALLSLTRDIEWKIARRTEKSFFFRQLLLNIARLATLGLVALAIVHKHRTAGDIVLVTLYLQQLIGNIGPIGRFFVTTGQTETSAKRIIDVLAEIPTVTDKPDAIALDSIDSIEFVNVSFSYPGKRRKILDDVSFRIDSGNSMALVGPSGAGKTTVTKLLLRFYEPTAGTILINGHSIAEFTQTSIRLQIGTVMQDVALFNDSIEENLRFAKSNASLQEIHAASAAAHASTFVEKLPEKYKTLVGERGVKLSGGEKQRIGIARAILRNPQLVILDEATSALDSESEQYVQQGLATLMEGKTAIIIAHRLSTIMKADQIIVLQDGKIIERGDHAKLSNKKSGLYARLYKLQTEGSIS